MDNDRSVSEALEEKVEHFQAMVYKCSVGFATEDDIEYAKEALLSEIRALREKLEEAEERKAEFKSALNVTREQRDAFRRQRDELVDAVREVEEDADTFARLWRREHTRWFHLREAAREAKELAEEAALHIENDDHRAHHICKVDIPACLSDALDNTTYD